jgi:hypothetical protein
MVYVRSTSAFQPGGTIVLVMTRWNTKDLTGKLLKHKKNQSLINGKFEFPAIMPSGEPVWPQFWKLDELEGVKASLSLPKWNAQWMQNPTSEEGALIKREWWQKWEKMNHLHYITSYNLMIQRL